MCDTVKEPRSMVEMSLYELGVYKCQFKISTDDG